MHRVARRRALINPHTFVKDLKLMKTITRHTIPYSSNASSYFEAIRDMPDAIWLDSGKPNSNQGSVDIISSNPDTIIETWGELSKITDSFGTRTSNKDPFGIVQQALDSLMPMDPGLVNIPFTGGILGFYGYDLGRRLVNIPDVANSILEFPDMRVGRYLWALIIDHITKKAEIIFHQDCEDSVKSIVIDRLMNNSKPKETGHATFRLKAPFSSSVNKSEYVSAVESIKNYILSGDCYQTNYTQHFSASYEGDTWEAYRALRNTCASPYSVFWQWEDKTILSVSPERFLKVSYDDHRKPVVETKPIKGTIPRGQTPIEDKKNSELLMTSEKDRAENLMIVDLLRNDISRNCETGTVSAPRLFELESFPNVHHLVSTVTGRLDYRSKPLDLLRDSFPGGSITGAPKKRAMEIIEELEPVKRSVYCGSIGYLSSNGRMDTNIAIRTVIASDSELHCWAGGGIVNDSDSENEYRESLDKINLIINTLEAS